MPSASPASAQAPAAQRSAAFASLALIATALWILSGALFKLFVGNPGDLPPVLFKLPLAKDTLYRFAIAIELVTVTLAFVKPRIGWWLCVGAMVVFDAILVQLIAGGAKSCGCFGGKVEMPPQVMLAIDSTLLVTLLVSRPWSALRWKGLDAPVTAIVALALASLPWLFDRSVEMLPVVPRKQGAPTHTVAATSKPADGGATSAQGEAKTHDKQPKDALRGFVILDAPAWVGKKIEETPLAQLMDVFAYDVNCEWVLWKWTCDHCRDHLAELARTYDGTKPLVLVRVMDPKDSDANGVVTTRPTGPLVLNAELPDTVDYVVTTPVVLELKDGVVVSAVENPGH